LIALDDTRYLIHSPGSRSGIFIRAIGGQFGDTIDAGELPERSLRREAEERAKASSCFTPF
jgi:hypothetical protein